jgi:itaconate CoA-transferase
MMGIQNEREWKTFCEGILKRPELSNDPRFDSNSHRVANRELVRTAIDEVFRTYKLGQIVALLDSAGIANAQVNDLETVWNHPQLASRNRWRNVGSPVGPLPALLPPAMPHDCEPRMDAIPALGQHTDSVLGELGYTNIEIADLRAAQAIL